MRSGPGQVSALLQGVDCTSDHCHCFSNAFLALVHVLSFSRFTRGTLVELNFIVFLHYGSGMFIAGATTHCTVCVTLMHTLSFEYVLS